MATLLEILKTVLPACITGIIGFLVAKYNYHKNIPLDKQEIAYDRVYYPMYRYLRNNRDVFEAIKQGEKYFNKYNKYVDRSTLKLFEVLKENVDNKKMYMLFKNNIYDINIKLRCRLGYLEPGILGIYTYALPNEKRMVRIIMEFLCTYCALILFGIINIQIVKDIMLAIMIICLFVLIVEVFAACIIDIYNKVLSLYKKKKSSDK